MQRLAGLMRKAVQDYEMLAPGDRVLIGVSGGKDSVALTVGLALLREYIGFDYQLQAVTLDPQFGGVPGDYAPLADLMARYGVPYQVRRTDIGPVIFDQRQEKNPCALCAKMRRGALHTAAQQLGCNKVALGHHLDDAVETFYMNLWQEGRIGCFSPVTYLSRRDLTLVRPMLLATEAEVKAAVYEQGVRPGAVPDRPRLPPKDPARPAGQRHRRLAAPAHRPQLLCGTTTTRLRGGNDGRNPF